MRIGSLRSPNQQRLRFPSGPDIGVRSGKADAVEQMLENGESSQLEGPTLAQESLLHTAYQKVDRGILLWAQQKGVRLQVLQPGEVLEEVNVLRDLRGRFETTLKPDIVTAVDEHLAPISKKIENATDSEDSASWRRQKRKKMADLLAANPCGAVVFTPDFAPILVPEISALPADPKETPSLKSLALHHGADTPEEQKQFYRWMKKLNGKRLDKARQATILEKSKLLERRPEARENWLRQARENPETVPLDTTLHSIVVPNAHFFPSLSKNRDLVLDRSDVLSIEGWQTGDFRGQWFFLEGQRNLLISSEAVGLDTPVHELGHVIDMTLERDAPDFYAGLRPRIEKAHYQARLHGTAITSYAMANRREYIAEGFAAYYDNPRDLRKKDPTLYRLVDEMIEFCCKKTGVDRKLDNKMQKMWREATLLDPKSLQPELLKKQFQQQLDSRSVAPGYSKLASTVALQASKLGILTGMSEVALGLTLTAEKPEQDLADQVQESFREGLEPQEQRELFGLGYQYGAYLASHPSMK